MRRENDVGEANGSILEETESVIIVFGEGNNVVNISPENCGDCVLTETAVPSVKIRVLRFEDRGGYGDLARIRRR
ncbi:unnamed protein product [Arabidopsis arenosa]|uniref:Uncharacterized protein n=1 Tax=Arabidopsis arenosa TaxID=38785 RepID=A0A8S1ZYG5_ARAAE|nr:unnamed protein product [Arabidopsis arenosa]